MEISEHWIDIKQKGCFWTGQGNCYVDPMDGNGSVPINSNLSTFQGCHWHDKLGDT